MDVATITQITHTHTHPPNHKHCVSSTERNNTDLQLGIVQFNKDCVDSMFWQWLRRQHDHHKREDEGWREGRRCYNECVSIIVLL